MEKRIQYLLESYHEGTITEEEKDEFYLLISKSRERGRHWVYDDLKKDMEAMRPMVTSRKSRLFKLNWMYYAACMLLLSTFYIGYKRWGSGPDELSSVNGIENIDKHAGSFRAYIKDGDSDRYIELDSSAIRISEVLRKKETLEDQSWQSLHTPKGAEFRLELEDGTELWLSPGATVRFPKAFAVDKREIYVDGEILLRVSHRKEHPFYVYTPQQQIEVKGTLFNVNSNPKQTVTTLIDGVVWTNAGKGTETKVIKPGESLLARDGDQQYIDVSIQEILAWRDGYFYFEDRPLEEILKKVALWYDVKIERGNVDTSIRLNARISKKKSLMEVARVFTLSTGIQFRLINNILVLRKY